MENKFNSELIKKRFQELAERISKLRERVGENGYRHIQPESIPDANIWAVNVRGLLAVSFGKDGT